MFDEVIKWRNRKVFEQLWAKCLPYYEQKYRIIAYRL